MIRLPGLKEWWYGRKKTREEGVDNGEVGWEGEKEDWRGEDIWIVAGADAFLLVNFRVWPDSAPFAYRAE